MKQPQSKEVARDVVMLVSEKALATKLDTIEGKILSNDMVSQVFDEIWRAQFDEDPTQAQRAVRQIVGDAIETLTIESAKP